MNQFKSVLNVSNVFWNKLRICVICPSANIGKPLLCLCIVTELYLIGEM